MTAGPSTEEFRERARPAGRGGRNRALKRKRGDGEIFDVIDEWLAPAFARWIASQQKAVRPEFAEVTREHKSGKC